MASRVRLGRYRRRAPLVRNASIPRAIAVVVTGAIMLVLFARLITRFHWDPALAAIAGGWVPPDLGVFLRAGEDVLHSRTPYRDASTLGADVGYVYPPLLAVVISPLSLLPGSIAASLWSLLIIACVLGALWLLQVSDWRCYLIALLVPFTRASIEYGTIGPLLTLLVAATWRFRDRPFPSAIAAAAAIAAKLLLWPLAIWFAATGRSRTAALSILFTVSLIVVSWGVIGFAGLAQYPELLDKASRQAAGSYSINALIQSLGASFAVAQGVSLVLGVAALGLAVWAGGDRRMSRFDRDRRSLTLTIAASLVLTPIVWNHYLVLLLVPVALARPRLSALWLAVLALAALDLFGWYRASPDGDLLPVAVVATIVTLLLVWSFRSHRRSAM